MSALFDELENKVRTLTLREKATLGIEQLWIDEAQRRYEGYLKGEIEASPGDAVMARARARLK